MAPHQDTQTRSRLTLGEDGPSDSALAAVRGQRPSALFALVGASGRGHRQGRAMHDPP
jgi:hypothetical protein